MWTTYCRSILYVIYMCLLSTVYMDHIFFSHSSANGHLGCFCVLTMVYSAAMTSEVHVPFYDFLGYVPSSGIAGSYSSVFLVFLRKWASLSTQLVKNPPAMQETPLPFLGRGDPLEKG